MNADTRAAIKTKGVSIWLNAELEVLMRRISKRKHERPMLLTADPAATLRDLLASRAPVYAQSDLTVQSREVPHDAIVSEIVTLLAAFLKSSESQPARTQT
jgi:shikimate kinase